jgi:hypothetical protein
MTAGRRDRICAQTIVQTTAQVSGFVPGAVNERLENQHYRHA